MGARVDFGLSLDMRPYTIEGKAEIEETRKALVSASASGGGTALAPPGGLARGISRSSSTGSGAPSSPRSSTGTSPDSSGYYVYDLASVVQHMGGAYGGHYITYRRVPASGTDADNVSPRWVRASDATVAAADDREVLGSEAYMLFYVRRDCRSPLATRLSSGCTGVVDASSRCPPYMRSMLLRSPSSLLAEGVVKAAAAALREWAAGAAARVLAAGGAGAGSATAAAGGAGIASGASASASGRLVDAGSGLDGLVAALLSGRPAASSGSTMTLPLPVPLALTDAPRAATATTTVTTLTVSSASADPLAHLLSTASSPIAPMPQRINCLAALGAYLVAATTGKALAGMAPGLSLDAPHVSGPLAAAHPPACVPLLASGALKRLPLVLSGSHAGGEGGMDGVLGALAGIVEREGAAARASLLGRTATASSGSGAGGAGRLAATVSMSLRLPAAGDLCIVWWDRRPLHAAIADFIRLMLLAIGTPASTPALDSTIASAAASAGDQVWQWARLGARFHCPAADADSRGAKEREEEARVVGQGMRAGALRYYWYPSY